jgi:di/tricarboxylate transporter
MSTAADAQFLIIGILLRAGLSVGRGRRRVKRSLGYHRARVSIHVIGVAGLLVVFVIGTLRPVNLGALSLVMTFLVGSIFAGEAVRDMYGGFPVDLLVLLAGVTYLFAIAASNGTVERIVEEAARLVGDRRGLIPWAVFVIASLPAMAGALGSTGVALLAPLSLRLAERYDIDRRMVGLMVVHGAAAGNFSPLNVLGAIVTHAVAAAGLQMSATTLFLGNLAYNVVLAAVIYVIFGGLRLGGRSAAAVGVAAAAGPRRRLRVDQVSTLGALAAAAVAALVFGLSIGFVALAAAVTLHLAFPRSSEGAEKKIAWGVVLLVCGIVTYVAALQRYGTVDAVGAGIAALGTPLVVGLLICAVGAVTSAFASSAAILGAMIPLAVPAMRQGDVGTTGLVVALAISATVVDSTPFSTVGALVVANAADDERAIVYRGLLLWGGAMVVTAPLVTWLVFILPAS